MAPLIAPASDTASPASGPAATGVAAPPSGVVHFLRYMAQGRIPSGWWWTHVTIGKRSHAVVLGMDDGRSLGLCLQSLCSLSWQFAPHCYLPSPPATFLSAMMAGSTLRRPGNPLLSSQRPDPHSRPGDLLAGSTHTAAAVPLLVVPQPPPRRLDPGGPVPAGGGKKGSRRAGRLARRRRSGMGGSGNAAHVRAAHPSPSTTLVAASCSTVALYLRRCRAVHAT
ncbi:hypothetical protein TRIUR3_28880 [Triticum urartu]|uniref:Uncharacterized protein n=1 Tax=Triticum urartu TaxID=4572 RepID=M7ZG21_TRIUA|nr:hypothetical protein TRIUR3_28880 [Triticum urartu]